MLVKFSVKAQGIYHIEKGKPCQDSATACLGLNNTVGIACVADGHGSSKYFRSGTGSVLAVQAAEKALFDFYGTIAREKKAFFNRKPIIKNFINSDVPSRLKQLEKNIIYNWQEAVKQDMMQNPFTESEIDFCKNKNINLDDDLAELMFIYGSTLLAGLVSDSFWFAIQIGDGLCVVMENDEKIAIPVPEDERLGFGVTTSLCDKDAIDNFREAYAFTRIKGLTVATDGATDSYPKEAYLQFNKEIYEDFIHYPNNAENKLQKFLPEISTRGSRDDVSIAGIFRIKER